MEAPTAWAATTYSSSRSRRMAARDTRAKLGSEASAIAATTPGSPGPSTLTMAMPRSTTGNAKKMSMMRPVTAS